MARIRSIKPEFPQSESMGRVSRDARLLFVMLWTICDDHGRARAHSRMLASLLFPYDEDAGTLIKGWLSELENEGCIRLYDAGGSRYLHVIGWSKHQKIDRPSKPIFPDPPPYAREDSRDTREGSLLDQGSRIKDQGAGKEREKTARPPATESSTPKPNGTKSPNPVTDLPASQPRRRPQVEFDTWLDSLPADEPAVKPDDPIFGYAADTGIPADFIELAWVRFGEEMRLKRKRQRDWRAHFRNSVRNNWGRLWWFDPNDGSCKLTTTGEQARRAFEVDRRGTERQA